ncbi:MAG: glucose 1-dehydrogenase [Lachnospiraceae bacterium]|nr:glucose 1-dehydrogenase [Lachnospiraceae bacterium]
MRLENKSIVVTGASSGMGKAIVELFAKEGANVVAVARRKERLEALAASLEGAAGKVIPFVGDVSKKEDNEAMLELAVKEFGRLDVLLNNAGIMDDMSPVGDVTDERYEQVFKVNVYGPMCAMRKAVQIFREQGNGGSIVNVASVGGMRTCAGAVYCASKAALISMTKNTAYMYIPDGIRCNAIAPGGITTEISTSMGQPNMAGYGRLQGILNCSPKPGEAEQIATAALFLASDDSSYVSGDVLVVDGGWIAG